ncbi:hypothetical protein A0J61_02176 [Choanephora cucurbitarum]|uniref:LysM domain-containing protein n=1 Tax=Choanephora cucurbitarum TaxID=101091 RepID=A0A1C7NR99_9FUNG|nr:hypothetical protein A0J61_02176 [Choanephora cucurbitarum]
MKFTVAAATLALVSAVSAKCLNEYTVKATDDCESLSIVLGVENGKFNCTQQPGDVICLDKPAVEKRDWFYKTKGLRGKKLALAKKKIASAKKHKKTTKKAAKKTTKKVAKKTTKKASTGKSSSGKASQSRPGDNWSSTPANAPSNAVRHIISTCTKYATVKSSDSWCEPFAQRNGITAAQLYSWNAGLHSSGKHVCDNLDDGRAYCVGVKN